MSKTPETHILTHHIHVTRSHTGEAWSFSTVYFKWNTKTNTFFVFKCAVFVIARFYVVDDKAHISKDELTS